MEFLRYVPIYAKDGKTIIDIQECKIAKDEHQHLLLERELAKNRPIKIKEEQERIKELNDEAEWKSRVMVEIETLKDTIAKQQVVIDNLLKNLLGGKQNEEK